MAAYPASARRTATPARSTTFSGTPVRPLRGGASHRSARRGRDRATRRAVATLRSLGRLVHVDPLLAELLRHLLLVEDRVLGQSHAFLRDDALLDHDLLLVQHDLVLFVGEIRAGGR